MAENTKTVEVLLDARFAQKSVREFHEAFGAPFADAPRMLTPERAQLRSSLIAEELEEYVAAVRDGDLVAVADALGDLLYVVYGTGVEHGIDLIPVFTEIHRSNMSKLGADGKPVLRDDGKILKGPDYSPPNLAAVVAALIARVQA